MRSVHDALIGDTLTLAELVPRFNIQLSASNLDPSGGSSGTNSSPTATVFAPGGALSPLDHFKVLRFAI